MHCVPNETCRSPYGERGLKYQPWIGPPIMRESLSLRRAWIEIANRSTNASAWTCRSPYGERGLKFYLSGTRPHQIKSLSLRRAWIEMAPIPAARSAHGGSLSLRRAWIEIEREWGVISDQRRSLSLRRAWIEITIRERYYRQHPVALLTESVD